MLLGLSLTDANRHIKNPGQGLERLRSRLAGFLAARRLFRASRGQIEKALELPPAPGHGIEDEPTKETEEGQNHEARSEHCGGEPPDEAGSEERGHHGKAKGN